MNNSWNKEILIVLIILIIILSTISSISSKDISNSIDNTMKNNNNKIESQDVYEEIITFIYGACDEVVIKKDGIIRDVELYCWGTWGVELGIRSLVKPFKHIHKTGIFDIYASKFFGRIIPTNYDSYIIRGYAIGNIEWV